MEIHQHHIAQSPTHSHHRYTNSEYYAQPYNSLNNPQQFDFQQHQHSMLLGEPHHQQIKPEHIKLESFGSPTENMSASPLQPSPPKMLSNVSPPSTSSPMGNSFVDQQEKLSAFAFLQPVDGDSSASLNSNYGFGSASSLGLDLLPASTKGNSAPKHDRKRPYPCITCSSRFGSKMELEEHQNSHTGQKPFECDICQSRFNRRSTLWNHRRIHSDAKPFSCTVCQMTFKWKNSLKCHKEMHLRKNESSTALDNDLKLLTYATAAKKQMAENSVNGLPPRAAIQTVSSRKKPVSKKKVKRELQEHTVSSTMASNAVATSLPFSIFGNMDPSLGGRGLLGDQQLDGASSHQHLAITHTSAQQHQQFDLSQINQSNLLMQAIYSGSGSSNTNTASNNTAGQQQTQLTDDAFDLINGSHSAHTGGLGLDLLPTTQNGQSFLLGEPKFNNDIASAVMQSTTNMRLPTNFPMNILDFQQQLAGNQPQQQQLSYIQAQQQQTQPSPNNLANTLHQQQNTANNAMLNYPQQAELLLDDMLNYQQTALDPSLLLNNQQSAHSNHQQQAQQQSHMDYLLNGAPVYSVGGTQQQQTDGIMAGSLHMQQLQQQQQMTLHQNMNFMGQQNGVAALNTNFQAAFMDDMQQISQEELQNLAKMLPYENNKW